MALSKRKIGYVIARLCRRLGLTGFGFPNCRSVHPVSRVFGFDRGMPVDRYYIEKFLTAHRRDICGRVLEAGDAAYTKAFGGDRVSRSDVVCIDKSNRHTTIDGNLETGEGLSEELFDCILLTQTLHVIYDLKAAVNNIHRALKPQGVALITMPGITQISRYDMERWGDYWRVTSRTAERLFGDIFGQSQVSVTSYGNVLAANAFLYGLAAEELLNEELDYQDPDYEVLLGIHVRKKGPSS